LRIEHCQLNRRNDNGISCKTIGNWQCAMGNFFVAKGPATNDFSRRLTNE
jgi:hypothetical protein